MRCQCHDRVVVPCPDRGTTCSALVPSRAWESPPPDHHKGGEGTTPRPDAEGRAGCPRLLTLPFSGTRPGLTVSDYELLSHHYNLSNGQRLTTRFTPTFVVVCPSPTRVWTNGRKLAGSSLARPVAGDRCHAHKETLGWLHVHSLVTHSLIQSPPFSWSSVTPRPDYPDKN